MSVPDSGNIFLSFDRGKLLKSDNDGETFTDIILDSIKSFKTVGMFNKDIGVLSGVYIIQDISYILITHDGWKTYEKFSIDINYGEYNCPVFKNDSILFSLIFGYQVVPPVGLLELNIKTKKYDINTIDLKSCVLQDLCVLGKNHMFACGYSNPLDGGSSRDAIYKSSDGGKIWRRVLDLYYDRKLDYNIRNPFGLQQIAFKDSLTGIAVGQFGKIVYTYDGGETWIYESEIPESISGTATMKVRYAGSIPLIATFEGFFHRMTEDNLAPKPEDTLSISGRVWEGNKGQADIPIALGYRVTMTDSNGYYRFTRLKKGSYTLMALNKYFDGANPLYYYKPFDYKPLKYDIELTHNTTGFDFNGEDLRTYHKISGYVVDNEGKGLADIDVRFAVSVTTADGLGLADTITKTDISGKFEFTGIESYKTWDITPVNEKFIFSPLKHKVRLFSGDTTDLKFTGTPTTSVWEKIVNSEINIYPNPTSNYITLSESDTKFYSDYEIYDISGRCLRKETLDSYRIDISALERGSYYLRLNSPSGTATAGFLKME